MRPCLRRGLVLLDSPLRPLDPQTRFGYAVARTSLANPESPMHRRQFLQAAAAGTAPPLAGRPAAAALPKARITKVGIHEPPDLNPIFNQSNMVVTVETDVGLVGVGEG